MTEAKYTAGADAASTPRLAISLCITVTWSQTGKEPLTLRCRQPTEMLAYFLMDRCPKSWSSTAQAQVNVVMLQHALCHIYVMQHVGSQAKLL